MDIIYLENTTSTSDYLLNLHTDKDVVAVADYQSAGRGAGTNKWESEPGKNLLFSMLIHPTWLEPYAEFLLSMVHAIALCEVLNEYASDKQVTKRPNAQTPKRQGFTIKWPNDIYWRDKKISGTIIDGSLKGGNIGDMVIGTGININQEVFVSDAPNPVSLYQITGREHDPREILNKIIERFQHYYEIAREEWTDMCECDTVMDEYHKHLYRHDGKFYLFEDCDGRFEARLLEVHPNGIMLLVDKGGHIREYEFKEVKFIL